MAVPVLFAQFDWSSHAIDAGVVVLYLVASFVFGLRASRMLHSDRESEEDYYLAGRGVRGWINGVSHAVTLVNADVAPAYCGMAVVTGLSVAWFYMSRFSLSLLLAAMLFAARWHQLGIRTGPEFFSLRFGGHLSRFARTYTSLYSVSVGTIPWLGAGLLGVHMIFAPIFDVDSKAITLLVVLPVLVSYVWISGYAGVLVTDVLQTIVIVVANIAILVTVLWKFGGPKQLAVAVENALPERSSEIMSLLPVWGNAAMGPVVVCAWMLVSTIGVGGSVALEGQRLFSCRSPREAATVGIWSEVALFIMLATLTLPMLGVLAQHPYLYTAEPSVRETSYGILLYEYLPPGLLGLALAALLASVMSTVAGHLNYGSQTLVNDVCRQFFPNIADRQAVLAGRLLMLVILSLSVAVMWAADSLVGIAVVVSGMFGSTLTFSWGQWWWWRVNIWSWCAATVGGPVVYLALGWLLPHWPWWQEQAAVSASAVQGMAMLQAVIAMAVTTTIWFLVALLTPPEEMETLKEFYVRAQPMGIWGPVRRAVEAGHPELHVANAPRNLILGGIVVAVVGAISIALCVLAFSGLVVGQYRMAVSLLIIAVPTMMVFRWLFRRHMDRLGV